MWAWMEIGSTAWLTLESTPLDVLPSVGQPGQSVEDQAGKDLLTSTHVARVITVGDIAVVKRLIFEAQTTVILIIKSQSNPNNDPSLRKLPGAERNSRLEAQRHRLQGMSLKGPLEVAHQVYDVVSGMLEVDALKYLGPAKCITRTMEISSQKPPKELKLDLGFVKVRSSRCRSP